ncbi:hypothetical protein MA16_Dca002250 [Dendrobium catenatum]|uniref:Uncharacterized protein n=1 Tax=Dendrobium catenatum TaxID=906689 RepID=A0A2I0VZZ2_9ASPA|nr:hypothetical protein MA16_Dca002250 [Dendrobium catenatum]
MKGKILTLQRRKEGSGRLPCEPREGFAWASRKQPERPREGIGWKRTSVPLEPCRTERQLERERDPARSSPEPRAARVFFFFGLLLSSPKHPPGRQIEASASVRAREGEKGDWSRTRFAGNQGRALFPMVLSLWMTRESPLCRFDFFGLFDAVCWDAGSLLPVNAGFVLT